MWLFFLTSELLPLPCPAASGKIHAMIAQSFYQHFGQTWVSGWHFTRLSGDCQSRTVIFQIQKGNHKPETARDIKSMSRQLSQCPQPGETRGEAAERDEGRSKGWCCLHWRCFPLISLLITICHRNQIKSQSVCSCVVFCVNWSRKKRIPELQNKQFSPSFWHSRSQSLPHSYGSFCVSKVCSWAGAYFVIQTWFRFFRWWWIHNLMNYIVLINSMVENFCVILYLNLSVFSIQLQNLIMLLSVRLRCSLHTGQH